MFVTIFRLITSVSLAFAVVLLLGGTAGAATATPTVTANGAAKTAAKSGHKHAAKIKKAAKGKPKKKASKKGRKMASAHRTTAPIAPAASEPKKANHVAIAGRVGPGSSVMSGARACTVGFVFVHSGAQFGSVSSECLQAVNGTTVTVSDAGVIVADGRVVVGESTDVALVELSARPGVVVDTSIPGWGGPVGLGAVPAVGDDLFFAIPGGVRTGSVQRVQGHLIALALADDANLGAGLVDHSGHAFGVIGKFGQIVSLDAILSDGYFLGVSSWFTTHAVA